MTTLNLLTVEPTDLTQLRKRDKGQFPFWRVYRIIDGGEDVQGHGTRDMSICSEAFTAQEGGTLADETRAIGGFCQVSITYSRCKKNNSSQVPI
jgi:hypothetical protein